MARRRGMSLIELLIAVVILAAVLAGLFTGIHQGYQGTERLHEESFASNHAISLLEALSLVPFSKLPEIPVGTTDTDLATVMAAVPEFTFTGIADPDYPRTVEVTEVSKRTDDPSGSGNSEWGALKRIQVEVTWEAQYLKTHPTKRLVFHTLVTDDTEVSH